MAWRETPRNRAASAFSLPFQTAYRPRGENRLSPRTGVLLVQPGQNARTRRVGDRAARAGPRLGRIRLVALENALAEGVESLRPQGIQRGHDSPES